METQDETQTQDEIQDETPTPADEPIALAPDSIRAQLRRNPEEMKRFVEALLERANVKIPEGYDIESAFADVLAVGAVAHDPAVQAPLARLGYWLFLRLPREGGGG